MDLVTLSAVSTSLNINQQSSKLFSKYSRSAIIHFYKYDITPTEYIYLDMICQGIESSPAQGVGHLIIYGIEGQQNDVSSDVYDAVFGIENGKMSMIHYTWITKRKLQLSKLGMMMELLLTFYTSVEQFDKCNQNRVEKGDKNH